MKTFKKALAVVMCIVMTLTAAPLGGLVGLELPNLFDFEAEAATYSGTYGKLNWTLNTTSGELNITGNGGMPWEVNGSAPWLPHRDSIKSVNIAQGIIDISPKAFWDCESLVTVTIPESVKTIGASAFAYCSKLTCITLSEGITAIGEAAFSNCTTLKEIVIPESVTDIYESAFYNCTSLADIALLGNETRVHYKAFSGTAYLNDDSNWEDDTLYLNKVLIRVKSTAQGNFSIKDGTYQIANMALSGCENLTNVTIPDSVKYIEKSAFYSCSGLRTLIIPDSVEFIGEKAFYQCSGITELTMPISIDPTPYSPDAFYGCNNIKKITLTKGNGKVFNYCNSEGYRYNYWDDLLPWQVSASCELIISEGITQIGNGMFYLGNIAKVTLPESLESIGYYAFSDCDELTDIYYNGSTTDWCSIKFANSTANPLGYAENLHINGETFKGVVELEEGLTSIGDYVFFGCNQIRKVVIPDSVTNIGISAFCGCSTLSNIVFPKELETIGDNAFYDCDNLSSIVFPEGLKTIGIKSFYDCDGLISVAFPSSIEWIGNSSFSYCATLKDLVFPERVETLVIAPKAFAWSQKIDGEVNIPDGTTTIGEYAFERCDLIDTIILPNTIKSIGESALTDILYEADIYYEGSLSDWCAIESGARYGIGDGFYLFINNKRINGIITIPNGITRIGNHAFHNVNITGVNIPSSVSEIGYGAFRETLIKNVNIPDTVISMEGKAFYSCTALTGATLGKGITAIENSTFYNCTSLNKIYFTKNVTSIADNAFYSCTKLTDVYFDGTEDEWYSITLGTNNAPLEAATKHFNHVHIYEKTVVSDSTCTVAGETKYTCECGATYSDTAELKEHTTKDWTVITPATCTTDGKRVKYCSVCKDVVEEEIISSPGHKYESTVTPPTCIADGYTTYTCSVCGDTYTDNIVPSTGHSYKATVVAPTCTKDGYTNNVCSVCGDFYHTDTVEKLGHTKGEWEYIGGNEYAKLCTVCGDKLESKIVTVDMLFNGENVNKKQILNKSTATVTATVTDNFVNDLVFASSDSSTVSIDANGNVVANNIGKATITVTIKGTAISDSIEVEVLPRDFTVTWNVNGKQTNQTVKEEAEFTPNVNTTLKGYKFIGWDKTVPTIMPAENLTFTAQYELIVKQLKVKNPSTSTINYGETLVMHADFGGTELPEGWTIQWTVEGSGFSFSPAGDGLTCKLTSVANGNATVKATLVDENGEAVKDANGNEMSDSKQLTSKAGFFQRLASFFKNLFGISRIILQSI